VPPAGAAANPINVVWPSSMIMAARRKAEGKQDPDHIERKCQNSEAATPLLAAFNGRARKGRIAISPSQDAAGHMQAFWKPVSSRCSCRRCPLVMPTDAQPTPPAWP